MVSRAMPFSSRDCRPAPITLKVSQKTSAIMPINEGMAVYLPVRMRSIFRLRSCSLLSFGFMTVSAQTL